MWLFCTDSKTSKKTRILAGAGLGQERNSASLPRDGLAGAWGTTMIMIIRVVMLTMMMMVMMTQRCHGHCGSNRAKLVKVLCGAHDSKEKGLYSGYLRTQSACEKVFNHFVSFFHQNIHRHQSLTQSAYEMIILTLWLSSKPTETEKQEQISTNCVRMNALHSIKAEPLLSCKQELQ